MIQLSARIDDDQIARISLNNSFMGNEDNEPPKKCEINKLTFYYDISSFD
jgi:hypothetical protein